MSTVRKTGRRPGKSTTKDQIITSAQNLFSKINYDEITIREIAKHASVDPALIMHYFGSKQELFVAAMTPAQEVPKKIAKALTGDRETFGVRLATLFIDIAESKATNHIILNVMRAVVQIPDAASLLKVILIHPILATFKKSANLDNAELRATLVQSQLIGIMMSRYVLKIEPIASLPRDELIAYISPTLQRYLTGDLGKSQK